MNCKSNFKNLCLEGFDGADCCIIGAGPSLASADYAFIDSMTSFAVNSAIMFMKWGEGDSSRRFWVSNDALCLRWTYWDMVVNSNCNIVVRDSWCRYSDIIPKRTHFFSPREKNYDFNYCNNDELCFCSSVPTCIDMALGFGFKRIFLFGVDHDESDLGYFWSKWSEDSKPRQVVDFNGDRKFMTKPLALHQPADQRKKVWEENMLCFDFLNSVAHDMGAEIINMSRKSKVKAFKNEYM